MAGRRRLTPAGQGARPPLWRSLLLLIVAGFGGLALLLGAGEDRVAELPPALAAEPDLTLEDSVITQYRPDGTARYRLAARRLSQFEVPREGDRVAELEEPRLLLYGPDAPPWRVRGDQGELHRAHDGGSDDRVELRGNVVLARQHGMERSEVRTAALTVYPAERRAESEQPVAIVASIGRATAVGFETDLDSGAMTLRSAAGQRVSIVLDPPPSTPPATAPPPPQG